MLIVKWLKDKEAKHVAQRRFTELLNKLTEVDRHTLSALLLIDRPTYKAIKEYLKKHDIKISTDNINKTIKRLIKILK